MAKKQHTQPPPEAATLVDEAYAIVVHPSGIGEGERPQIHRPDPISAAAEVSPGEVSPPMTLEVWLKVSGHRPEQIAGFRSMARRRKLAPASAAEWMRLHAEFMSRPVK